MSRKRPLEEKMIRDLLKRKRAYEKYFKSKKENPENIDPKAESAYASLVKLIVEISKKADLRAKDPEEMKRLAEEILENDYGIKRQKYDIA